MKLFFLLLLPLQIYAHTQVAFIEMYDRSGNLIILEPGGRYAHTAISYQGLWLQAHPWRGVELVAKNIIEQMGIIAEVIDLPETTLEPQQVEQMIGLPFDRQYLWDDEKIYCSELVGKLLDLETNPMFFDPQIWPAEFQHFNGKPGLSPDAAYWQVLNLSQQQNQLHSKQSFHPAD